MTDTTDSVSSNDALDELAFQLLGCGAVLSQMVSGMIRCEAAGRSAPDAAPIPTVAQSLIRGVLGDLKRRYSRRDLNVAAAVVQRATDAICENIFFVPLEELPRRRAPNGSS
jgi:hypothetical protein